MARRHDRSGHGPSGRWSAGNGAAYHDRRKKRLTHDGWNRLVKVEFVDDIDGSPTASTVGDYAYNGLNWRIIRRADTDLDNDLDQQRMMYYSAAPGIGPRITPGTTSRMWQLLEEDVWDGWTAQTPGDIDRHVQHVRDARCTTEIGDCPELRITVPNYQIGDCPELPR